MQRLFATGSERRARVIRRDVNGASGLLFRGHCQRLSLAASSRPGSVRVPPAQRSDPFWVSRGEISPGASNWTVIAGRLPRREDGALGGAVSGLGALGRLKLAGRGLARALVALEFETDLLAFVQ